MSERRMFSHQALAHQLEFAHELREQIPCLGEVLGFPSAWSSTQSWRMSRTPRLPLEPLKSWATRANAPASPCWSASCKAARRSERLQEMVISVDNRLQDASSWRKSTNTAESTPS